MRRIAIWNTAFLGDVVLTLPLVRTIAAAFPDAAVDLYVRRGLGALFAAQPEPHAVYEYDKRGSESGLPALWRLGRTLAGRGYDLWISTHKSPRSAAAALRSRATARVGYSGGLLQRLAYTQTVSRRFGEIHEVERLMELARPILPASFSFASAFNDFCPASTPLAGEAPLPTPWPELVLPKEALERAAAFKAEHAKVPLLGMHPGSVWPTKRWHPAGFAAVARRAVDSGAEVLLFAGKGEEFALAEDIVRLSGLQGHPRFHNFSGAISLPELAAFIGRLDCYLANDSGPMHMAWALRTPVSVLFGPTAQELGFTPLGPDDSVCEIPLACRPCGLHGHLRCPRGHHDCMGRLDPADVWRDVEKKLRKAGPSEGGPSAARPSEGGPLAAGEGA